jgi:hypothetical protein
MSINVGIGISPTDHLGELNKRKEAHGMETGMFIFTFTSKEGNIFDGNYNFVAKDKLDAIELAVQFETKHNNDIVHKNNNYSILLDIFNIRSTEIKKGFILLR